MDNSDQRELEGALFEAGDDFDNETFEGDDFDRDDADESSGSKGGPEDGKAEEAMEFLSGLLYRMGLSTRVTVREDTSRVVLDIAGPDAGRAIGKKGQALDALQFLVNKVVNRFPESRRYIVVDAGDYRERHDDQLAVLAKREAKRAIETGRTVTLDPMPARDRRIVHLSLAKFPGISTKSNGEGFGRRIQIIPANATGRGPSRGAGGQGSGGGGGKSRRGGAGRGRDGDRRDRPRSSGQDRIGQDRAMTQQNQSATQGESQDLGVASEGLLFTDND